MKSTFLPDVCMLIRFTRLQETQLLQLRASGRGFATGGNEFRGGK
jgi:hypothetical protein